MAALPIVSSVRRALVLGVIAIAVGASCARLAAQDAKAPSAEPANATGFAVVELFTSEGCSSCPPADRLLAEIDRWGGDRGARVYPLSFHVDYWNRLGWTDPYSSPQHTARQESYAAAANEHRVYTPQMIVNGTEAFVGSSAREARRAVEAALGTESRASLAIEATSRDAGQFDIAYRVANAPAGAVLNVAIVQPGGRQRVTRGENAGRTLDHANVVRAFRTVRLDDAGGGSVRLALPGDLLGAPIVVAYVQEAATKRVVAAASTVPAS